MSHKLLLVTYHFPPSAASGSFRALGLARHLPKFGWQPIVVAPPTMPWEPTDPDLAKQLPADTKLYSAPYPVGGVARMARRVFGPDPVWLPRGLKAARAAIRQEKPEVVVTSGPPHWVHFLGLYLKRTTGIPWVADLRDPWVGRGDVGTIWTKTKWIDRQGEAMMFRHADAVIANAPIAESTLKQAFPECSNKIHVVTNGFDPEPFLGVERPAGDAIRVVHTGEMYLGRDPRTFLDALRELSVNPIDRPIHAAFLGRNTGGAFDLDAEVTARGINSIVNVGGQVSYRQSLQDMAAADILLLLDGPGRKLGVPAKLYEYLGAGRPILALTEPDGDSGWVLRQSGVPHRIVSPPSDGATIRQALIELIPHLGETPDRDLLQKFTREHLASRFAEILNSLIPSMVEQSIPLATIAAS